MKEKKKMIEIIIKADTNWKLKEKMLCYMLSKTEVNSLSVLLVMDEKHDVFHISVPLLSKCFVPLLSFRVFKYGDQHWMLTIEGEESSV